MQYSKAVAEQKSIDNILKELTFKRSHLLTQATNAKMEIDSYQKRLDEVKRNIELYTPKDTNKLEYSPKPWPVLKLVSGPTPNGQSSSRYTSEHTELGDAPLLPPFLSPPRIRREVMTYREFMRKYHQWSPGTNIEKDEEIEEFEDDKPSTASFPVPPPAVPSVSPSVPPGVIPGAVPATTKSTSSVSKKLTWVDDDSDDDTVVLSLTQAQVTSPPLKRALEDPVVPGAPKKTKLTTKQKSTRSMCSLVCEECGRKPCIIAFSASDTLMPHMCAYNSPLE
jgi:hypothetical protein